MVWAVEEYRKLPLPVPIVLSEIVLPSYKYIQLTEGRAEL